MLKKCDKKEIEFVGYINFMVAHSLQQEITLFPERFFIEVIVFE